MNQTVVHNLSTIPGFIELLKTEKITEKINDKYEKYYSIHSYSTKTNQEYKIIKYNKDFLASDIISTYGLLRSIILSNSRIVSFAPPKSLPPDIFISKYPSKTEKIIAEDFIEGTMINVFYDFSCGINGAWQIATRNTVGAEVSFYKWTKKTFKDMFMEACIASNFNLYTLNTNFCYSFVLQHPDNRIVVPFKIPRLYLVGVYKINQDIINNNVSIEEQDMSLVRQGGMWHETTIRFPDKYTFSNYSELIDKFASSNTPYDILGIVVKNKETGERTKFRNPIYEEVKHLRGNEPKLQYQYLCLRQNGKLSSFLTYFPETKLEMSKFRDQLHMFTNTLHKNYISCYVNKEKPLKEFPEQYRTHMFKIHEIFLKDLRAKQLFVTNTVVINYVNKLPPSLLMYCLNHNLRKRTIDTIKANSNVI
jgi:hypothetical protein